MRSLWKIGLHVSLLASIAVLGVSAPTFAATTTPTQASSTTSTSAPAFAAASQLSKSLVNIVCLSADPQIPSISGSGVMIDSRGIILTAAHVAQMFLLADYLGPNHIQCLIRSGSPARRAYLAEPIYVSQSWLRANPATLTSKSPMGTGQFDVGLLAVTATATSTPLPNSYHAVPLSSGIPSVQQEVGIAAYPAQDLSGNDVNYSLYPVLVFGNIQNRYTFATNTVDELSVQGTTASQEGSSGGGVVNTMGQLLGIITTSSITGPFVDRVLNAITIGHIRAVYQQDMGMNLDTALSNSTPAQLIKAFAPQSQTLGAQLAHTIGVSK